MLFQDYISHCRKEAESDLKLASALLKGECFLKCLSFCYMAMRKILRALVVERIENIPDDDLSCSQLIRLAKLKDEDKLIARLEEIYLSKEKADQTLDLVKLENKCSARFTAMCFSYTLQLSNTLNAKNIQILRNVI